MVERMKGKREGGGGEGQIHIREVGGGGLRE